MNEPLEAVWPALADPTRRQLLDLLRHGPRTTGALCGEFDMSRYGVMKHLGVLEAAGLVTVRRKGRERFNYLNAVPLRLVYERWVDKFSNLWARSLLDLKQLAEQPEQPEQPGHINMSRFEIAQELTINAPRDKVWKALTTDIGKWWAFHIGTEGSEVSLDARLGGSFTERWGDGEGALWGIVTFLSVGEKLRLEGALGLAGPGTNKYTYELEDTEGGTLLKLTHYAYGIRDEDTEAESRFTEGWKLLLGKCLPAWLEHGTTYDQLDTTG